VVANSKAEEKDVEMVNFEDHPTVQRLAHRAANARIRAAMADLANTLRLRANRPAGETIAIPEIEPTQAERRDNYFTGWNDGVKYAADCAESHVESEAVFRKIAVRFLASPCVSHGMVICLDEDRVHYSGALTGFLREAFERLVREAQKTVICLIAPSDLDRLKAAAEARNAAGMQPSFTIVEEEDPHGQGSEVREEQHPPEGSGAGEADGGV
jgi:hypothetical protein